MKGEDARARLDEFRIRVHGDGAPRWPGKDEGHVQSVKGGSLVAINRSSEISQARNELLDFTVIAETLQQVSNEIAPDRLIRLLMKAASQYAGSERAVLIMYERKDARVVAEAISRPGRVEVNFRDERSSDGDLPGYAVELTRLMTESTVREDVFSPNGHSPDDYIWQNRSGSMLGLPLMSKGKLIALLVLEDRNKSNPLVPECLVVLKLLASQAAMSFENMRLTQELHEREAQIRRLVDANIIGIAIWTDDGQIAEANDAFMKIIGYSREDIQSGRIRWADLTPPELREDDQQLMDELKAKGSVQPYEREYRRRDGTHIPVLISCTSLDGAEHKTVAFVIDMTERKRSEAMLRALRTELEHASRVMTIGELGASIAHETNQPLTAIVTNASALLRWLDATPPNLVRAHETAEWIVRDGEWAADVVRGLKALSQVTLIDKKPVDLNQCVEEILPLIQGDLRNGAISLTIQPAQGLKQVLGDRVQLQQVICNLIKNSIDSMAAVQNRPRELLIATYNLHRESVGVLVRDTGMAVAPDKLDYIFDRFYSTKAEGFGIGLSISRSIIENHGGQLWATINKDVGMTFEFTIRAYKPEYS
ncbi:ATP-binding protein [Silvibacterium dinghuense]|uniref:histidine kinase n=1 Tax=Silvibacterium dinghuense TaxID=1560006 RepID=A0A4V1NUN1_9BACT|nr:ATP-binding protein [Silvibacterium dinghuense]RXS92799.1 PAS domain S-box protein [Silvibacterium dinghuense]GGH17542.1 hypothetical protein GCM10011586_40100 [Silvibacterium dinghuense]